MAQDLIDALILNSEGKSVDAIYGQVSESELPDGDVIVRVDYSTLNYKDAMIINGIGRLVRDYPHVPGIDFSGIVESSGSSEFKKGDRVVLNGARVGEIRWGGYATKARVMSDWLIHLPANISNKDAMGIGTAGFSAMLAIMVLEEHGLSEKDQGEILVTGAAGGVGSVAVSILANLGYNVVAATGRPESHKFLKSLGATSFLERKELQQTPKGPLGSQRWSGVIDNVGGETLSNLLGFIKQGGSCASVGNAESNDLHTSVIPFLLRGINLLGIDSVSCPKRRRQKAWDRLSKDLPLNSLSEIAHVIPFNNLLDSSKKLLDGKVQGRLIVDINN